MQKGARKLNHQHLFKDFFSYYVIKVAMRIKGSLLKMLKVQHSAERKKPHRPKYGDVR